VSERLVEALGWVEKAFVADILKVRKLLGKTAAQIEDYLVVQNSGMTKEDYLREHPEAAIFRDIIITTTDGVEPATLINTTKPIVTISSQESRLISADDKVLAVMNSTGSDTNIGLYKVASAIRLSPEIKINGVQKNGNLYIVKLLGARLGEFIRRFQMREQAVGAAA
jgi:hypothetical protein